MRLFPGDDVPALSAFPDEMRPPWILPQMPRAHRDRLAMLVGRALARFDGHVRLVSLRWVERRVVSEGRLRLPDQPIVWWRIEAGPRASEVLREAPATVNAMHLYDFDDAPEIASVGWLGPLKVQLLHRITDVLVGDRLCEDPEPVIDRLSDAAERLVSPIDLLDFAERLLETHVAGLSLDQAEADAYAVVIAGRFAPVSPSREAANGFIASLEAAAREEPLPEAALAVLSDAGLVEPGVGERGPLLEVLGLPKELDPIIAAGNVIDRVAWRVGGVRGTGLPASQPPPTAEPIVDPKSETEAERVLSEIRAGRDRGWTEERCGSAAQKLLEFANETKWVRGHRLTPVLLEREATLWRAASDLLARAGHHDGAALLAIDAGQCWFDAYRLWEATSALEQATKLSRSSSVLARGHLVRARIRRYLGDRGGAAEDLEHAFLWSRRTTPAHDLARVLEERAVLQLTGRELHGALADCEEARVLHERSDDALGLARTLGLRAEIRIRLNDFAAAAADLEEAVRFARQGEGLREIGRLLLRRGSLRRREEDASHAMADYEAALRLFEQIEDRRGQADVLLVRGILRRRGHDLTGSFADNAAASSLYRQIEDRTGLARATAERSILHLAEGNLDEAAADNEAAAQMFHQVSDPWGETLTTELRGRLAHAQGDLGAAAASFEEAARLYEQLHDGWGRTNALFERAATLVALGRRDEALATARRAFDVASAAQNRATAERAAKLLSDLEKQSGAPSPSSSHLPSAPANLPPPPSRSTPEG